MTRDEELLNEIIQRRGYIVLNGPVQLRIGELVPGRVAWCDTQRPFDTEAKWYVVAPTDRSDMDEQTRLAGQLFPGLRYAGLNFEPYFYRVLCD